MCNVAHIAAAGVVEQVLGEGGCDATRGHNAPFEGVRCHCDVLVDMVVMVEVVHSAVVLLVKLTTVLKELCFTTKIIGGVDFRDTTSKYLLCLMSSLPCRSPLGSGVGSSSGPDFLHKYIKTGY